MVVIRSTLVGIALLLVAASPAAAQRPPRAELSGGYAVLASGSETYPGRNMVVIERRAPFPNRSSAANIVAVADAEAAAARRKADAVKRTLMRRSVEAETLVIQACRLWDRGRDKAAFKLLERAARLGDDGAQLNLGYCYDVGKGLPRNRAQALLWYRRASKQGNCSAANNIGTLYRDTTNRRRAIAWFRRAIAQGCADSAIELAKLYLETGNVSEATRLLRYALRHPTLLSEADEEAAQSMLAQRTAEDRIGR